MEPYELDAIVSAILTISANGSGATDAKKVVQTYRTIQTLLGPTGAVAPVPLPDAPPKKRGPLARTDR